MSVEIEHRQPLQRRILRPMLAVLSKYCYNLIVAATIILNRVEQSFRRFHDIIGTNQNKTAKSLTKDIYLLMISFETDMEFDLVESGQPKYVTD